MFWRAFHWILKFIQDDEELLAKIGLIQKLNYSFCTTKDEFCGCLKQFIDKDKALKEKNFPPPRNLISGFIDGNKFELELHLFGSDFFKFAKGKGTIIEQDDKIIVEIIVNSYHMIYPIILIFGTSLYTLLTIYSFVFEEESLTLLVAMLIQVVILWLVTYFTTFLSTFFLVRQINRFVKKMNFSEA